MCDFREYIKFKRVLSVSRPTAEDSKGERKKMNAEGEGGEVQGSYKALRICRRKIVAGAISAREILKMTRGALRDDANNKGMLRAKAA